MSHRRQHREAVFWAVFLMLTAVSWLMYAALDRAADSHREPTPAPAHSFMSDRPDLGHGRN